MLYTDQYTLQFIQDNLNSDTGKLLLAANKYPQIEDMHFVVDQILGKKQIKEKLPKMFENKRFIIPSRIAAEQCSSYQTAAYKQRLLKGKTLCDLTGGMGIDSFFFSLKTEKSYYIERFEEYCEAAIHNFSILGANNIQVIQGDSREIQLPEVDTFYIDPARRGDANKRLFLVEECEPNIVEMKEQLLSLSKRIVVKLSPMADIQQTLRSLPETVEIHVISVKNECKELLFILEKCPSEVETIPVYCINYRTDGTEESFTFSYQQEQSSQVNTLRQEHIQELKFIYEPNSSVMKAGAFKAIASHFNLIKAQAHSHLYFSKEIISLFPGRKFQVDEMVEFSSKNIKSFAKRYPKANLTTRNFPLSTIDLRKKLKIAEGGDCYIFATTINDGQKILIIAHKAE